MKIESNKNVTIGGNPYSFLSKEVMLLDKRMQIFLFFDMAQHDKLLKSQLEQKYKNIFLSSTSHQLRTPLNSNISFMMWFRSAAE